MGEYVKEGKLLHSVSARTIRELVDKTNSLKVPREDVVTIMQANGGYVILYYYQGV